MAAFILIHSLLYGQLWQHLLPDEMTRGHLLQRLGLAQCTGFFLLSGMKKEKLKLRFYEYEMVHLHVYQSFLQVHENIFSISFCATIPPK